ncbi:MAG: hypothetical protein NTX82_00775 [Candidatus Parcubacteria bacterium]|nr:hypothetical protein [Candidatus Parcubacteria bacterium]
MPQKIIIKKPFRLDILGNWSDNEDFLSIIKRSRVINCTYHLTDSKEAPFTIIAKKLRENRLEYTSKDRNQRKTINYRNLDSNPLFSCYKYYFQIRNEAKFKMILRQYGGLELTTISQLPYRSGLGTSAALIVGFLEALEKLYGKKYTKPQLAQAAYQIEKNFHLCGWQDHYASVFKGPLLITIKYNDIRAKIQKLDRKAFKLIEKHGCLIFLQTKPHANVDSTWILTDELKKRIRKMDVLISQFLKIQSKITINQLIKLLQANQKIVFPDYPTDYQKSIIGIQKKINYNNSVIAIIGAGPAALFLSDRTRDISYQWFKKTTGQTAKHLTLII